MTKRKKRIEMDWLPAPDIARELNHLVRALEFTHIDPKRIITYRSIGSKARIKARIWSLPRVWQMALNVQAHYIIEVKSEVYDALPQAEQTRTLIHELMHIPKTFSGALAPHHGRFHKINHRTVEILFQHYQKANIVIPAKAGIQKSRLSILRKVMGTGSRHSSG